MTTTPSTDVLPPRIILFDGVCAVCDAGMTWIMDHDPERLFTYAPLQGDTAARLREAHPEIPDDLDTIVFVDRTTGTLQLSFRTDALLDVCGYLGAPWRWFRVFRIVPRGLRDWAYDVFAAWRYRIFGTIDACRLPAEDEVALMLP